MTKLRRVAMLLALACAPAYAQNPASLPMPATGSVQVGFTPWDNVEAMVVAAIDEAQRQILVQAFSFTSRPIASALINAKRRGVDVQVLADRTQTYTGEGNRIPDLVAAGIPVRVEVRYASAHNKVMIIDAVGRDPAVITGSFNWTRAAQRQNAENVVILRRNRPLADAYLRNWKQHHADALPYASAR